MNLAKENVMNQILYRKLQTNEAQLFWNMMNELDHETKFMMYEPGERENTASEIKEIEVLIQSAKDNKNYLFIAEVNHQIIGYILALRGTPNRVKHTAYIVTGIKKDYRGKGIGKTFFTSLDNWAKGNGIKRLELTVIRTNLVAKRLYEQKGFVVEGTKKNAMMIDGDFVDEFYMAKLL
ncbi:acetyltransferase [Lactococcus raffinolactis]|nr:acetyltransferase [Lactococcus raffinolactis]